jgi:hypothetical protein
MAKITFQVTLENVELSNAAKSRLDKEINALVASYVVKAVPADASLGTNIKIKLKPEWLGIWLKRFKSIEDLKANQDFKKYTLKVPQ